MGFFQALEPNKKMTARRTWIWSESQRGSVPFVVRSLLSVVLWFHTCLISKRLPVQFWLGAQKLFSPLYRCHLNNCMTSGDVRRHLFCPQRSASHSATWTKEEDGATTTVYWRGAERGDKVVLSGSDNNSTMHL
jgi:hypothetical protein